MHGKLSLSILVPVYNEQYLVETSLKRLAELESCPEIERIRVIVINDASKDGSAAALERFRANTDQLDLKNFEWIFLDHDKNQGKGAAIRPEFPMLIPTWSSFTTRTWSITRVISRRWYRCF